MQGFGKPHYTNVQMPFPNEPPHVPEENPTGIYRREFTLPADWQGRRIVLHFGGCEGALYVYVNGKPVGISKDARTPAEFDVTGLVNFGGPTSWWPSWCNGRTRASSRTRITGGRPASSARSISTPPARRTSRTFSPAAIWPTRWTCRATASCA